MELESQKLEQDLLFNNENSTKFDMKQRELIATVEALTSQMDNMEAFTKEVIHAEVGKDIRDCNDRIACKLKLVYMC